jgi:hypothetical protein
MREIIIIVLGDGRVAHFLSCQSRFLMEAACVPHCLMLDLKYTPNKHTYRLILRHKAVDSRKRYQIVVVSLLTKCHQVRVNKKGITFLLKVWQL